MVLPVVDDVELLVVVLDVLDVLEVLEILEVLDVLEVLELVVGGVDAPEQVSEPESVNVCPASGTTCQS